MTPSEFHKIRDGQMMLKEAYSAWVRAKNKKTDIVYVEHNGDLIVRKPSGHKRIIKCYSNISDANNSD